MARRDLKEEIASARNFLTRLGRAQQSDDIEIIEKASDIELKTLCKVIVSIVEGRIPLSAIHFHEIPKKIVHYMDETFDSWDPSQASRKKCLEVLMPLWGQFQKLLYHMFRRNPGKEEE